MVINALPSWPTLNIPKLRTQDIPKNTLELKTLKGMEKIDCEVFTLYVCGITPYDATHLGHAATYLTFDLISRYLLAQGKSIHFSQNITDIDDPLLERAAKDNISWEELAKSQIDLFRSDMSALHIMPPEAYVPVTTNIIQIVEFVSQLQKVGATYNLDGDIYFKIEKYLNQLPLAQDQALEIFTQRGGDPERIGKMNPLDPLLWRAKRPGEPFWETKLGAGRPGWHIECSVIALETLGKFETKSASFVMQGGGSDLIFPHHFMSSAQVSEITNKPFARYFVNTGMLGLHGEKMSKSLGNLVFVSKLISEGYDPMEIRWALMTGKYSDDRMWENSILESARKYLKLVKLALSKTEVYPVDECILKMNQAISDNLDTKTALEILVNWAQVSLNSSASNLQGKSEAGILSRYLDAVLGLSI